MTHLPAFALPGFTVRSRSRTLGCVSLLGIALLSGGLSGCGASSSGAPAPAASASAAGSSASATGSAGSTTTGVSLKDAWVKAAPNGMTAIFGTLDNPTDRQITVSSATAPVAATVEMHEVAMVGGAMTMRRKAGGFVVPAHGTHQLAPSGDHFMMMGLTKPIKAGDLIAVTLTLSDGGTVPVSVIGKDFAAGNESYQPSGAASVTP